MLGQQGSGQRLSPLDSGGPWTAPSSFGRPLLQAKRSWHVPGCAGGSRGIRTGARHERRLVQEQMHAVEGAVSGTRTGLYGPPWQFQVLTSGHRFRGATSFAILARSYFVNQHSGTVAAHFQWRRPCS